METVNKFGVKFSPYFEEPQLLLGYGESVCYLVDDLLNRELIRRDYKFDFPVILEASDEEREDIEEEKFEPNKVIELEDNMQNINSDSPNKSKKIIVK